MIHSNTRFFTVPVGIFIAFLALCFLGGGASRGDVLSLLYLRPAAIIVIAALLILPIERDWRPYRSLLLMLAAFAGLVALQLVPLPPARWTQLPGRGAFTAAAEVAGQPQPWRPLSLTPELTAQSLLAFLFPLATLVCVASIDRDRLRRFLPLLIGGILLSAALGVLQLTAGESSPFHFYEVTHRGAAVGVFANRNHQAAMLALCIPMLRVWTLLDSADSQYRRARHWLAFGLSLFLVAMILVTGSRAGLALGLVGFVAAYFIAPVDLSKARGAPPLVKVGLAALPFVTAGAVVLLGRATAIQRLLQNDVLESEARIGFIPIMLEIVRTYFPIGTGFGSFDPVFRLFETDSVLDRQFFNHAHNEVLELAITGGVPALLVLLVFLMWYVRSVYLLFRKGSKDTLSRSFGRLGAAIVLLLLLASVVDYPLRTPLLAVIFTIGCCWIVQGRWAQKSA